MAKSSDEGCSFQRRIEPVRLGEHVVRRIHMELLVGSKDASPLTMRLDYGTDFSVVSTHHLGPYKIVVGDVVDRIIPQSFDSTETPRQPVDLVKVRYAFKECPNHWFDSVWMLVEHEMTMPLLALRDVIPATICDQAGEWATFVIQ